MVKILFFGDLVDSLGLAAEEMALPADITDVEGLIFHLSTRGEKWAKSLRDNPNLTISVNKKIAERTTPIQDGDEIALVGFLVI